MWTGSSPVGDGDGGEARSAGAVMCEVEVKGEVGSRCGIRLFLGGLRCVTGDPQGQPQSVPVHGHAHEDS